MKIPTAQEKFRAINSLNPETLRWLILKIAKIDPAEIKSIKKICESRIKSELIFKFFKFLVYLKKFYINNFTNCYNSFGLKNSYLQ